MGREQTLCLVWCLMRQWSACCCRLGREARWRPWEDRRQREKGACLCQPADLQGTSAQMYLASVHYIWCTWMHEVSESQILCLWLLSWTIVCGSLNLQGLCFQHSPWQMLSAWEMVTIVSRIKTGEKVVDVQYLRGFIALCFPVLMLLWIQYAAVATQESALTNSWPVS